MTNHIRLVLERREPFAEGMAFGQVGQVQIDTREASPRQKWLDNPNAHAVNE